MDLWVAVAAAAAAAAAAAVTSTGPAAKHWQEVGRKSEVTDSMDKQPIKQKRMESGNSIFQILIRRQIAEDASSSEDKISPNSRRRSPETRFDASLEGLALTSGIHGEFVGDRNSLLSLQPWVFRKNSYQDNDETMKLKGEFSGENGHDLNGFLDASQAELSPRSIRFGYRPGRSRSSLRSRRTRRLSVGPLSSAANCLIPQLYDQHFEIEEYVFSSPPSRTAPTMKPFIITDGNRIISRSSHDPLGKPFENELYMKNGVSLGAMGTVIGVPSLPELRTPKRKSRDVRHEGLDTSSSRRTCKLSHSQGSPDVMFLFSLGISIGMISTILSNRREVEKLNNLLKDSKNLVQDLQEELEMKESVTVKELVNEACESQELHGNYADIKESIDSFLNPVPTSYLPVQERNQYVQLHMPKAVENSDSMSKIEAELEAELERLELNMNSTSLEGRVSALGELDSDLVGDTVHGELRADLLESGIRELQADPNRDSSGTSTADTHNPNYAVSPRELSLRLHEVIQYRLEERIHELERDLQHRQKQLQFMEAERVLSQGTISSSDIGSTNPESPPVTERDSDLAQPFCLELSGDALNAYDEAYEELMRMNDAEESLPPTTDEYSKLYGDGLLPSNQSLVWGMEEDGGNKPSTDVEYIGRQLTSKQMRSSRGSNNVDGCDGGDEYEIDDEEGKMIQQIVERRRQGSPVLLHAQRLLFSMDE